MRLLHVMGAYGLRGSYPAFYRPAVKRQREVRNSSEVTQLLWTEGRL